MPEEKKPLDDLIDDLLTSPEMAAVYQEKLEKDKKDKEISDKVDAEMDDFLAML